MNQLQDIVNITNHGGELITKNGDVIELSESEVAQIMALVDKQSFEDEYENN